jgi:hypothetical protein
LGTGGTVKDDIIEIQGDRVKFITEYFIKLDINQINGGQMAVDKTKILFDDRGFKIL